MKNLKPYDYYSVMILTIMLDHMFILMRSIKYLLYVL